MLLTKKEMVQLQVSVAKQGEIVAGFVERVEVQSPEEAEAFAIRKAVLFAQSRSESITIESDATAVVSAIKSTTNRLPWAAAKVVKDTKLIAGNSPIRLFPIKRTANFVVDWVVKQFLKGSLDTNWVNQPCNKLRSLLLNDVTPTGVG